MAGVQEVAEMRDETGQKALKNGPAQGPASLRRIRMDMRIVMGFSNLVAFLIISTTAATVNIHGMTNIRMSSRAGSRAQAIAGKLAFLLISIGMAGTRLVALSVLAGSATYAMAGCSDAAIAWH